MQLWYYVKAISDKEKEEASKDDVDNQGHKEAVVDPHKQEGWHVKEEQLKHEVLEAGKRFVFQLIYSSVYRLNAFTSQSSTLPEH